MGALAGAEAMVRRLLAGLMLLGGCGGVPLVGCASMGAGAPLTAHPRVGFAPTMVNLILRLSPEQLAQERFYCPAVAWDFGDGSVSAHEADCAPWEASGEDAQVYYSQMHLFKRGGTYVVRVALFKAGERVLLEEVVVHLRPGLGEVGEVEMVEPN